jgi:hypothetical protein
LLSPMAASATPPRIAARRMVASIVIVSPLFRSTPDCLRYTPHMKFSLQSFTKP